MTRDGTELCVYKNGVLHDSLTATTTQNGNLGGSGDLQIGMCATACCRLEGFMDELVFYSRALSPTEVNDIYNEIPCQPCQCQDTVYVDDTNFSINFLDASSPMT